MKFVILIATLVAWVTTTVEGAFAPTLNKYSPSLGQQGLDQACKDEFGTDEAHLNWFGAR